MIDQVVCPYSKEYPRNSEADIIELEDGSLLLGWSEFYGGYGDHTLAQISGKISEDGGKTWKDKFIIQENVGSCNVMSVSFIRLQSGDILFFHGLKNSISDCRVVVHRSTDEGRTWSEGIQVTSKTGYHILNNARVIQLTDGRLLAPVAHTDNIEKNFRGQKVFCYISDDEGQTWHAGRETGFTNEAAMEPGLVELTNGDVLMIIRTQLDYIYYAYSSDRGETWSEPIQSNLISPSSPATITRIPTTDDLLIIWNNNEKGAEAAWSERTPLTAAISKDEGKSWTNIKNIENDLDYCYAYTSITFVKEDVLLTYYYWQKGHKGFENTSLKFKKLPVKWFYQ